MSSEEILNTPAAGPPESQLSAPQPPERVQGSGWRTAVLVAGFTLGLGAFLFGITASTCGLGLLAVRGRASTPTAVLPFVSLLAAGLVLGLPLALQAIAGLAGTPSHRFIVKPASGLIWLVVYVLALVAGQTVLSLGLAPSFTLPPLHVVALGLPPLLLLGGAAALVKDPRFTWRGWWGGLGSGAFGSLLLAFAIEMMLLLVAGLLAVIILSVSPNLLEPLRNLRPGIGAAPNPALVRSILSNPVFIIAILISVSMIVPLVEEAAKSLVPMLAGTWQVPSPAHLFLWGVASGAGFAVIEGMLNGGLTVEGWAGVALLRVGSSAMHCLGAGLTGWGWGEALGARRWMRLLLAYALAVVIHGLWNAASIGVAVASAALAGPTQRVVTAAASGLLIAFSIGAIAALLAIAAHLSKSAQAAPQGGIS